MVWWFGGGLVVALFFQWWFGGSVVVRWSHCFFSGGLVVRWWFGGRTVFQWWFGGATHQELKQTREQGDFERVRRADQRLVNAE